MRNLAFPCTLSSVIVVLWLPFEGKTVCSELKESFLEAVTSSCQLDAGSHSSQNVHKCGRKGDEHTEAGGRCF